MSDWPEILYREGEPHAVTQHPSGRHAARAAQTMRNQTVTVPGSGAHPTSPPPLKLYTQSTPREVGRRFQLQRSEDVSGVSGTGVVADGCQFPDGVCVVHWRGEHRSTVVWTAGIRAVEAVHGHEGRTRIVWVD